MVRNIDHVTVTGSPFGDCMGVPGIEAEHRTLVRENATPHCEMQWLTYRQLAVHADPAAADLARTGFNHVGELAQWV